MVVTTSSWPFACMAMPTCACSVLLCACCCQNTVIIHSLEGRAEAGTRLARILLWIYMLSALPISILLSFFLQTVPLT